MHKLRHDEILQQRLSPESVKSAPRFPLSIMLSNVRSLYNVGSIFRSCDAAGVSELILCGFTPHPPRTEIAKTALGAVDTVPWRYFKHEHEAIAACKEQGLKIIAVELTKEARDYTELKSSDFPCCLVLGNELVGIADEVLELCDESILIPMHGVKHSLNVAVAAGIVMFEAIRHCE